MALPKKPEPTFVHRDFVFANDRALDEQIEGFRREHEAAHNERLAMHARRDLGANKVRVTFRVVPPR